MSQCIILKALLSGKPLLFSDFVISLIVPTAALFAVSTIFLAPTLQKQKKNLIN